MASWSPTGKPAVSSTPTRPSARCWATTARSCCGWAWLVEDEPVNREITQALLQSVGLVVDTVEDGLAAVDRVLNQAYDLVLMDMQMPTMDGLEATRRLRQLPNGENLPVVAMTANAFDEDRARCLAAGMNDLLAKPTDAAAFFDTVLRWLDRPAA